MAHKNVPASFGGPGPEVTIPAMNLVPRQLTEAFIGVLKKGDFYEIWCRRAVRVDYISFTVTAKI